MAVLVKLARERRGYLGRLATIRHEDALVFENTPEKEVLGYLLAARPAAAQALEKIRQHEASKLGEIEARLQVLIDTAKQRRPRFEQDAWLGSCFKLLVERNRALAAAAASENAPLAAVVALCKSGG
jgi:hypothetical protein